MKPTQIGMLLFPGLTQLDLTGPFEVFWRMPETKVHLLWKTRELVTSDSGLAMLPTMTLRECPPLDIVFVPGGPGQIELMEDEDVLAFLREQARGARYVTSVCTGSLVLAAAGLLAGYRAASHWLARDFLTELGAEACQDRYVIDRNRVTGGGVTAGIDFGLKLAALLHGDAVAQQIQLQMEYNPEPPFDAGSPERAGHEVETAVRKRGAGLRERRRLAVSRLRKGEG